MSQKGRPIVFKMPGGMPENPRGSSSREWTTLIALVVFLLAILGFRSYIGADKSLSRHAQAVSDVGDDDPGGDASDPNRKAVLKLRAEQRARAAAAEQAGEQPDEGWRQLDPQVIPLQDAVDMLEGDRQDEAEASTFLPPLSKFRPLEPMPVLAMRARVADAVNFGAKLKLAVPGGADALALTSADGSGLTAAAADGSEKKIAWADVSEAALFDLARAEAESGRRDPSATEWLHLSQLAGMVGAADAAGAYRAKALALDATLEAAAAKGAEVSLDVRVLNECSWPWDDPMDPEPANNLTDDTPSIVHVYRYMRTVGLPALRAVAVRNPEYAKVLRQPAEYRGKVIRLEARYVKRFKSMRLTGVADHADAGVQDLDFGFVVDAHVRGIYLVSAPQDLREFADSDIVSLTGVYIRRWPYIRHGVWKWVPWIAALKIEKFEIAPIEGWRTATYLLVAGAAIVFAVIAYYGLRDSKEGLAAREKLTRMRTGRDHVRRKVAEAMAAGKLDAPPTGAPSTPDATHADGAAPPPQDDHARRDKGKG
jgi:hypothetical protein